MQRHGSAEVSLSSAFVGRLLGQYITCAPGVTARNPKKYVLDEAELVRVSTLARTELEDARIDLERVSKLAQTMGKDDEGDNDDDQWEELSAMGSLPASSARLLTLLSC